MASWWDNIQIKTGKGGCGDVTVEQKNNLIEHAVTTWEDMGLSDEQLAFGIGVMGLESGFNPHAKGTTAESVEYGLGQFTKKTWEDAVNYYNKRPEHTTRREPHIDADKDRDDPNAQIAVMGPWLRKTWDRAGTIPGRQRAKGFGFEEIAYQKWKGMERPPKAINERLRDPDDYNNPNKRGYFTTNVNRARQAIAMRKPAT